MTNADCIRRMSDEQLYEFLSEWECGDIDYSVTFCDLCNEATKRGEVGNVLNLDCDGCRKHWLQRDAVDYGGLMYWKRNTTFEQTEPQDWKDEMWKEAVEQTEPQKIYCPKCGSSDYIKDLEKDFGVKDSTFKYKCINCNTYIKDEPQTETKTETKNSNLSFETDTL